MALICDRFWGSSVQFFHPALDRYERSGTGSDAYCFGIVLRPGRIEIRLLFLEKQMELKNLSSIVGWHKSEASLSCRETPDRRKKTRRSPDCIPPRRNHDGADSLGIEIRH